MFDALQVAYWLALSTWFGGVFFIALMAPVIFRTVRDADPTLPKVLSVNLEQQHATLLSGTIVGAMLELLERVELACAGVLLIALIGQWFVIDHSGSHLLLPIVRCALFIAAAALLIYDWRVLWPRVQRFRQQYIDHADEPEIANAAKDEFDRAHADSVMILRNTLFVLLGIILFSADIRPALTVITFP